MKFMKIARLVSVAMSASFLAFSAQAEKAVFSLSLIESRPSYEGKLGSKTCFQFFDH